VAGTNPKCSITSSKESTVAPPVANNACKEPKNHKIPSGNQKQFTPHPQDPIFLRNNKQTGTPEID